MGVKFSSIVFLMLAIFIVKISLENLGEAKASDTSNKGPIKFKHENVKLSKK